MEELMVILNEHTKLLIFLLLCNFVDIGTGFLKGIVNGKLSSKKKPWKKIGYWLAVTFGIGFDWALGYDIAVYGITYTCIAIEAVSLVENITEMGINIPILSKLTDIINEKGDTL